MHELVARALEEAGSVRNASRLSGISDRLFQRWKNGHAQPKPQSLQRLRVWLEGDDAEEREARIRRYEARAALGRPLFV